MWIIDTLYFITVLLLVIMSSVFIAILFSAAMAFGLAIMIANRKSNCTNTDTHDKIDS